MSADIVLKTHHLVRKFGGFTAVDDVSLSIKKGIIFGFLGPNGSGKSTTMRMLMGLLIPTSGAINVLGLTIPQQSEALRLKVGYMTQRFSLYEDLSVGENLRFVAGLYDIPRPSQRIHGLLSRYRLMEKAGQRSGTLSGGQRQRLALAAAVIHQPKLLILDEPTSAVDPESRRQFWEDLFSLADDGATILVSTHLMDEAERCHRVAVFNHGRLAADSTPETLIGRLAGRVFAIRCDNLREVRHRLLDSSGVQGVSHVGQQLRVLMKSQTENNVLMSLQSMIGKNHGAIQVEPVAPNLEDVFVDVTQEY